MKKSLFISLSVMILLTVIVGYTAYNIVSRWGDMSDVITRSVAKGMLLEEITSSINREVELADFYNKNPSLVIKSEVKKLDKRITENIKSLNYLTNNNYGEAATVKYINVFYKFNIYEKVIEILKSPPSEKKIRVELLNNLIKNNFEINDKISTLKVPEYRDNIDQLRNYSKSVTAWITLICGFLGFILMYISINHITKLYNQIEKQAKREKTVRELTSAVCSTFDIKDIFSIAIEEIVKNLNVDRAFILENTHNEDFNIVCQSINKEIKDFDECNYIQTFFNKSNSLFEECKSIKKPVIIPDVENSKMSDELKYEYGKYNIYALVIVPIILQDGDIYGFIQLECFEVKKNWTIENIELIKNLSNQLSIAISNAKLFEKSNEKTKEASELAKKLEINLDEIKVINKELIKSNELNVKIQEDERLRIAYDLHDEVIQGLIGLVRKADSFNSSNKGEVQDELRKMIAQIRKICQNLRPSILHDLGLQSAIEWLMDDLEKYGVVPNVEIEDSLDVKLPEKKELVIFRIIQELTNNVKKHSQATNAWLKMEYNNECINIYFKDDGCGFDFKNVKDLKTLGLIGISERIKSVSGEFKVESLIDEGTNTIISIPLSDENLSN